MALTPEQIQAIAAQRGDKVVNPSVGTGLPSQTPAANPAEEFAKRIGYTPGEEENNQPYNLQDFSAGVTKGALESAAFIGNAPYLAVGTAGSVATSAKGRQIESQAYEMGKKNEELIKQIQALPKDDPRRLELFKQASESIQQAQEHGNKLKSLLGGYQAMLDVSEKPLGGALEAENRSQQAGKITETIGELALGSPKIVGEVAESKVGKEIVGKGGELIKTAEKGVTNSLIKGAVEDWSLPATINKPGFNKAAEIFNRAIGKGHNIGDTIVKNKIDLAEHVVNGAYNTLDTANQLREDAGKLSRDLLRPSLQKADTLVPRTPVKEIIGSAINNVKSNKFITQETRDALISQLKKSEASLKKQYPKGISLSESLEEKITRDLNSKYNPLGDIASTNEANKNKAIADALRANLETKAPKDLPIKEFNNELSKQYQTADYLEALNGKKVPLSTAAKIRQTVGKVIGAATGHGVGGGILGTVGGYHIGGMVESILENIPATLRGKVLQNLEKEEPEAFKQIKGYLNNLDQSGSVNMPNTIPTNSSNIPKP